MPTTSRSSKRIGAADGFLKNYFPVVRTRKSRRQPARPGGETGKRWRMLIRQTPYQIGNAKFWSMGMRRMRATVKDREVRVIEGGECAG